jgi:probable O-glycosylation ligase (exosortase A-associated)
MVIFHRDWKALATRETMLVCCLAIWFTVTSLIATHTALFMTHSEDTWARWHFVMKILLMTVVTVAAISSFQRLRIVLLAIAGCFGFFVLKSVPFILLTGGGHRVYGPDQSMIADNNDFGLAMNMTLPILFFLGQTEEGRRRYVFRALFAMTIPTILFTYSRGALVGLAAVLFLMLMRLRQRLLLIPVIILAAVLGLIFAPEQWQERMDLTGEQTLDASARGRLNAWAFSWNLALDYPITGGGFDTFTLELFHRYAPDATDWHGPHSVYFQILAEHGFVGLALFLALVLSCFLSLRGVIKRARLRGDDIAMNYANMFQFSLFGFLTSGLFLGRAYFDYFYTLTACVAALSVVLESRWRAMDAEAEEDAVEATP